MKQHQHLRNLVSMLRRLRLDNVPALVVDDEADHATPAPGHFCGLKNAGGVAPRSNLHDY
jgi:hypothetical protein